MSLQDLRAAPFNPIATMWQKIGFADKDLKCLFCTEKFRTFAALATHSKKHARRR